MGARSGRIGLVGSAGVVQDSGQTRALHSNGHGAGVFAAVSGQATVSDRPER